MRLLIVILLASPVRGEILPGIGPAVPEAAVAESLPAVTRESVDPEAGEVLMEDLRSIELVSFDGGEPREIGPGISASDGMIMPSSATLAAKLGKWLGQPLTVGGLGALGDEILIHYDVEGYPVVGVEAPEQDLKNGKLIVMIEVGRLGEVAVSQPKHGDPELIRRGLHLRPGAIIRRTKLDEQLAWYGRNSFRRPRLFVSPGAEPATADLLIALEEKKPWQVSVGYDNSGPELVGRDRFLIGAVGMTRNEHLLALQTVVGTPASSLQAYALRWEIPFHSIHQVLRLDAAFADVSSSYVSGILPVENEGTSWGLTAQQRMALPGLGQWRQNLGYGFEVKGTNQFLLFGGGSQSPGEVVFVQGKLSYELSRSWSEGGIAIESGLVAAPGNLGGNNSDASFQAYDPQADSDYLIGRIAGEGWWSPGADWQMRFRGSAQMANTRLLPAEQFAIGGYQSVRGAPEREFFEDDGWQASLELLTPLVSPVKGLDMRGLIFWDNGRVGGSGAGSESLSSMGLGLRMRVAERMELRFDHGWLLDGTGGRNSIGINLSF